jgi:hypothetical protein
VHGAWNFGSENFIFHTVGIWPLNLIGITGEPITWGIEQKIAFLRPMRDAQKGKSVLVYPDRLNVVPALFVRD